MAIKDIFHWKAPDSTQDLNARTRGVRRSIFPTLIGQTGAGLVTPSASTLLVSVEPFIAQGHDGLTILSDSPLSLTLPVPPSGPSKIYWLTVYARYQLFQPSIIQAAFVEDSVIQSAQDRDYFIRFAKVTVAPSTTNAAAATWDFSVGDHSELLGQSPWKGTVATAAALPVPPSYSGHGPNKDGDVRVALDTHFAYVWNQGTQSWGVVSGAGSLTSAVARSNELDRKVQRSQDGTGFVALGHNEGAYADVNGSIAGGFRVGDGPIVNSSALTYGLRIAPFEAVVNGHKIVTRDETVTLPAPPAISPLRYDLVYMEVYRSKINTPINGIVYANNLSGTYTFAQIETLIEQVVNEDPYFASSNFNFGGVELADDGSIVVTLWRWSVDEGITYNGPTDANYVVSNASPVTVPGFLPLTTYSACAGNDRIGIATNNALHPAVWDGTAYAVPVFVVRRVLLEASYQPSVSAAVNLGGVNIWSVMPTVDASVGHQPVRRLLQSNIAESQLAPGILRGYESDLSWSNGGSGGPLVFQIPQQRLVLSFPAGQYQGAFSHGLEVDSDVQTVVMPAPPGSGARRDLVYLVYWATPSYMELPNNAALTANKAFATPVQLLDVQWQGGRTIYVYGLYMVASVGTAIDEADAFAAATLAWYETGGAVAFAAVAGADNPGLWQANVTGSPVVEHGIDRAFAMPIAIVHRRNSAVYSDASGSTNFNGSSVGATLRPEEEFGGLPAAAYDLLPREAVDLRHATGTDIDALLEKSLDMLSRGELQTVLQRNPIDSTIAGKTHLAVDVLGGTAGPALDPANSIVPATSLDNIRHAFTDAPELQILSWTPGPLSATVATGADYTIASDGVGSDAATHYDFRQNLPFIAGSGSPVYTITYNSAAPSTKLRIRAPKGAYIHSSMRAPQDFVVNAAIPNPSVVYQQIGLVTFAHIHGSVAGSITAPRMSIQIGTLPNATYGGGSYDHRISYNYLHDSALGVSSMIVRAVDALGRPTDVELTFPFLDDPGLATIASSSGLASPQVVCAFQYDKPKTARALRTDYLGYGNTVDDRITGLSLPPKKVYNIRGVIRGVTYNDISVGPLYKTVTKAMTGTSQITISAADFPGETTVAMFGLLGDPLFPAGVTPRRVRAIETGTSFPGTGLTITFDSALPGSGNVSFKVAYSSDQKKYWFEVLKTNRGVVGPFAWASDEQALNTAGGGGVVNNVTGVNETTYLQSTAYPPNPQNRFTIGIPNTEMVVAGQIVGEEKSIYGWFNKTSGGATNYYVTNDFTWYSGTNANPWGNGSFGRHDPTSTNYFPVLGATSGYYDTTGPHAFFFGGPPSPVSRSTILVYPTTVPLNGGGGDYVVIVYEGYAYQGVMGDNETLVNRLARLQSAIVPANVGESLTYEAVSNVWATTAGTGLPFLDGRHVGVQTFFFTAGVANPTYRGTFYAPDLAKENGISNAYRQERLNSERLRPVKSIVDAAYTYPDDDSDMLMQFIPGPPTQYCPSPNVSGVDIGSFAGVGPGTMSDYDHATLTNGSLVVNDIFLTGDRGGYQRVSSATIQVPAASGYATVRVPYQPAFASYWTGYGSPGGAQGDQDLLLNQTIGDFWQIGQIQKLGNLPPSGHSPQAGFKLTRTISNGDLTTLIARQNLFTTFVPESVGKPHVGLGTQARGTQGYQTFRPGFAGAIVGTESTWLGRPSENLLSGCAHDATLLAGSSIGPLLLSESSQSLSHQASGNILFATGGYYYDQVPVDYTTYPVVNNLLMPQHVWAFRGSAVNRAGVVRLLINSGFGSDMTVDVQNGAVRYAGVRAHTGFSADAFELLHRPVRRH